MLTAGGIAIACLVLALVLAHYDKASKLQIVLMGAVGAGIGGTIGTLLTKLGHTLTHAANTTASKFGGAVVPWLFALVLVGILAFELEPGNKSPSKWAKWVAILLFPVLIIAGGAWAQVGGHGNDWVRRAGNSVVNFGTSLAQGW